MINKINNKKLYADAKQLNETCQRIIDSGKNVKEASFKHIYEYIIDTVLPDDDETATYDWLEQLFPAKGRELTGQCWYGDGIKLDFYPFIEFKQKSRIILHGDHRILYDDLLTRGYVRQCIKMFHLRVK